MIGDIDHCWNKFRIKEKIIEAENKIYALERSKKTLVGNNSLHISTMLRFLRTLFKLEAHRSGKAVSADPDIADHRSQQTLYY